MKTKRYIPEILEDILSELKKLNRPAKAGKPAGKDIETRPLPEESPKRGRKPSAKAEVRNADN